MKFESCLFCNFRVPDARAVNPVAAEAVDVRAPREVAERRALAVPLERRVLAHLDDRLAVLEVAAVVIELEVVDGVVEICSFCSAESSRAEMMSSHRCDSWISSFLFMCAPFFVPETRAAFERGAAESPRPRRGTAGVYAAQRMFQYIQSLGQLRVGDDERHEGANDVSEVPAPTRTRPPRRLPDDALGPVLVGLLRRACP